MADMRQANAVFFIFLLVGCMPIRASRVSGYEEVIMDSNGVDIGEHRPNFWPESESHTTDHAFDGLVSSALMEEEEGVDVAGSEVVLMNCKAQYKMRLPRVTHSSGYRDVNMKLVWENNHKNPRGTLRVVPTPLHSDEIAIKSFYLDDRTAMQVFAERGVGKAPQLLLQKSKDNYLKIRAPRNTLESSGPTNWFSTAEEDLVVTDYTKNSSQKYHFKEDEREQNMLQHLLMSMQTQRDMLNLPQCIKEGTCVTPCGPPISTPQGLTCVPQHFCHLKRKACEPIIGDKQNAVAWLNARSALISALNKAEDGNIDQDELGMIISQLGWLRRMEAHIFELKPEHLWVQKLPKFYETVLMNGLHDVVDQMAGFMEDSGALEKQMQADFGCNSSTKLQLRGLSDEARAAKIKTLADECPGMAMARLSGASLLQKSGQRTGLEPIITAILWTAGLMIVFLVAGGILTNVFKEDSFGNKVGQVFLVAGAVCAVALVIELMVACHTMLDMWTCRAIGDFLEALGTLAER